MKQLVIIDKKKEENKTKNKTEIDPIASNVDSTKLNSAKSTTEKQGLKKQEQQLGIIEKNENKAITEKLEVSSPHENKDVELKQEEKKEDTVEDLQIKNHPEQKQQKLKQDEAEIPAQSTNKKPTLENIFSYLQSMNENMNKRFTKNEKRFEEIEKTLN